MIANSVSPLTEPAEVRRAPTVGGAMLYDASRAGNASVDLFDPGYWRTRHAASHARAGRGQALYVDDGVRHWVLRHYLRGGLFAALFGDRYFWNGEARTRPFREWRLLHELRAEGLPVPVPVAARYRKRGLIYRGDLITERIVAAQALSAWLDHGPVPAQVWRAVGACVRRFHDRGVWHADLNAHNILVDAQGAVSLVDFDRGRRRAPGAWRAANLERLRRSLDKIDRGLPRGRFGASEWRLLVEAYGST